MSVEWSVARSTATKRGMTSRYAIHHIRARSSSPFVSRTPCLVKSVSREWTQRRESATSFATSRAVTAGPSLSRITLSNSSSLTWRGRPAPMTGIHPHQVKNQPKKTDRRRERERQILISSARGRNTGSQSLQGISKVPARWTARDWLSEATTMKAITADGLESIEFSGIDESCEHPPKSEQTIQQEASR